MKKNLQQLNVDSELFKKIKKRKKTIYVLQNEDYLFLKNEKVIITNSETDKKLKRKIIKTYEAKNIEELKKSLKRKSK